MHIFWVWYMKNKLLFVFSLMGIVLLSGCVQQTELPKDCGKNETCFKESGKSCSRVTFTSNESSVGMIFKIEILNEMGDKCEILIKNIKSSQLPTLEGKEAICVTSKTSIYEEGTDSVNLLKHGDKCQGELIDEIKNLFLKIGKEIEREERERYPEVAISEDKLIDRNEPEVVVKKYFESWDQGTVYTEGCILTIYGYYYTNKRCSERSKELQEVISGCTIDEYELTNIETQLISKNDTHAEVYVEYNNLNTCWLEEIGRINDTVALELTDGGWKIIETTLKS